MYHSDGRCWYQGRLSYAGSKGYLGTLLSVRFCGEPKIALKNTLFKRRRKRSGISTESFSSFSCLGNCVKKKKAHTSCLDPKCQVSVSPQLSDTLITWWLPFYCFDLHTFLSSWSRFYLKNVFSESYGPEASKSKASLVLYSPSVFLLHEALMQGIEPSLVKIYLSKPSRASPSPHVCFSSIVIIIGMFHWTG